MHTHTLQVQQALSPLSHNSITKMYRPIKIHAKQLPGFLGYSETLQISQGH